MSIEASVNFGDTIERVRAERIRVLTSLERCENAAEAAQRSVEKMREEVEHCQAAANDANERLDGAYVRLDEARQQLARMEEKTDEDRRSVEHIEAQLDGACADYIEKFDVNGDGRVTPMEIMRSVFSGLFTGEKLSEAEHIVKAMFRADENGDAVVDLAEFTRAVRRMCL